MGVLVFDNIVHGGQIAFPARPTWKAWAGSSSPNAGFPDNFYRFTEEHGELKPCSSFWPGSLPSRRIAGQWLWVSQECADVMRAANCRQCRGPGSQRGSLTPVKWRCYGGPP